MKDDLASGFQDVDRATDFVVFSSCLTLVDSIPFFAECKSESYDLLGARPAAGSWTSAAAWVMMPRRWRGSWRRGERWSASIAAGR